MRRIALALIAVVSFACSDATSPVAPSPAVSDSTAVVVPDQADHGGRALAALLTGSAIVLPDTGDPDGAGTFEMTANTGQRELCYALRTSNIGPITAVHLHRGAVGEDGEGVFTLSLGFGGYASECVDHLDRSLIHDILRNPEGYYIVVHTVDYPDGSIRGQLAFHRQAYQ